MTRNCPPESVESENGTSDFDEADWLLRLGVEDAFGSASMAKISDEGISCSSGKANCASDVEFVGSETAAREDGEKLPEDGAVKPRGAACCCEEPVLIAGKSGRLCTREWTPPPTRRKRITEKTASLLESIGVQRLAWGIVRSETADACGVGSKRIKI